MKEADIYRSSNFYFKKYFGIWNKFLESKPTFTVRLLFSLKFRSARKNTFKVERLEEKEADIYRSPNFLLREEYIKNIFANS